MEKLVKTCKSALFLFLFVVVLLYMLLTTVVKTVYQKKYHELI